MVALSATITACNEGRGKREAGRGIRITRTNTRLTGITFQLTAAESLVPSPESRVPRPESLSFWLLRLLEHVRAVDEPSALAVAHGELGAFVRRRRRKAAVLGERVELQVEERATPIIQQTLLGKREHAFHHLHDRLLR